MPALDDVTQTFDADVEPYVAALKQAIEMAGKFAAANEAAAKSVRDLDEAMRGAAGPAAVYSGALAQTGSSAGDARDQADLLRAILRELMDQTLLTGAGFTYLDDKLSTLIGHEAAAAAATRTLAAAMGDLATRSAAADAETATPSLLGRLLAYKNVIGGFSWGAKIGGISAWHLALDLAVEALIAVGTATLAAAAGFAVLYPTMDEIRDQLVAIHTVNASLGYQIPGLQSQFDKLAHAMAPQGIELYGGALRLLTGQTGIFGQAAARVVTLFDDWMAKIDLWAKGQGTFAQILNTGTSYLKQFGQIFGEVGIAIGNVLRDDPGIARYLLDIVSGALKLIDAFTRLPQPVVFATLALHGLWLWGRVLGGMFLSGAMAVARFVLGLAGLTVGEKAAATGAYQLGTALRAAAVNPFAWVGAAAAALVYLALTGDRADASTTKLINNMNTQLAGMPASQAILQIGTNLGILDARIRTINAEGGIKLFQHMGTLQQASDAIRSALDNIGASVGQLARGNLIGFLADQWRAFSTVVLGNEGPAAAQAETNALRALDREINAQLGSQRNLFHETGNLIRQHFTYAQSLALMDLAGVRATDSFALMQQKVTNLITGYQAMSIRGGILANSVNAVTFATEQQDSKISQLNSAWSSFFSMVTGGASGFITFVQSLNGAISSTAQRALGLSGAAAAAGGNLGGLTQKSLSAQQAFLTSAQDAQTEMNNLTMLASAAGLGARGTAMLTQAMKDMIIPLLPLAAHSKTLTTVLYALAQQAGYQGVNSFKALQEWVGKNAHPMRSLQSIVEALTIAAGNLADDVRNLSTALGTTLNQAMSQAIFYANGGQKAFNNYASALIHTGMNSSQTQRSATALAEELISVTGNTKTAQREFEAMSIGMGLTKQQADILWNSVVGLAKAIDAIKSKAVTITVIGAIAGNQQAVNYAISQGVASSTIIHARMGQHGLVMGMQGGGIISGMSGIDKNLFALTAGEGVLNPRAVAAIGGPMAVHTLNSKPSEAVLTSGGGMAGAPLSLTSHITVELDGRQIASSWRTDLLTYNRRNPSSNVNLRVR